MRNLLLSYYISEEEAVQCYHQYWTPVETFLRTLAVKQSRGSHGDTGEVNSAPDAQVLDSLTNQFFFNFFLERISRQGSGQSGRELDALEVASE